MSNNIDEGKVVVNDQDIITSLFMLGFEQVDCIFATLVMGKLTKDTQTSKKYKLGSGKLSDTFNKYVSYDKGIYKLKDGFTMDSVITSVNGLECPLARLLHVNVPVVEYFQEVDFMDIIDKKIKMLGFNDMPIDSMLFSSKEKEIYKECKVEK